jgi:creatinine amidohydrolase
MRQLFLQSRLLYALVIGFWLAFLLTNVSHAATSKVELTQLTWREVDDAITRGKTTIIIPIGGTEQNGSHMALDKHNQRVKILSERIALSLGNALVAPVVTYVPEGNIDPPTGHMRYPGTISISDAAFAGVITGAANSFRQAGFVEVVLIGDSGNYQSQLKQIAADLNRQWSKTTKQKALRPLRPRVHFIAQYYLATQQSYVGVLRDKGLSATEIGTHAASADTSLMLALDATLVRENNIKDTALNADGVGGDARRSSAALGQLGVSLIVDETVKAIRQAIMKRS